MIDEAKAKQVILGTIGWIAIGAAVWLYLTRDKTPDAPNQETAAISNAAQAPVLTPEQAAEKETAKRYGHHCLSVWDGSHRRFVEAVKDRLNDSDSFDHIETTTWPVQPDGRNVILMRFRARNAFGGVIQAKALGSFSNDNCADVRIDKVE